MLAQPLIEAALSLIFVKMATIYKTHITKRQRDFLVELFRTVFALRGRINFTNLARFSHLHEHTFRRHFSRAFDWLSFNLAVLRLQAHPDEPLIGVFDTSFLPKSGKHTWGLDKFFSSAAQAVRTGLEVSLVGVIATRSRRTIALDATQTPPGLSRQESTPRYGRMEFYLEQLTDILPKLPQVRYWVGDGGYARRKVFTTLTDSGKHLITKLRPDANLRFLVPPGYRQRRGRPVGMQAKYALPTLMRPLRVLSRSVCWRIYRMSGSTRRASTASTLSRIFVLWCCTMNATGAIWCCARPIWSKQPRRSSCIIVFGISWSLSSAMRSSIWV